MTETGRIRWQDDGLSGNYVGYVGTLTESAFRIYSPDTAHETWLLSVRVAAGSEFFYGDGLEPLKAEAERWLAEFVSSLGAVFPEADRKRRAAELCQPLMEASDIELRHVLILIGADGRHRLRSLLLGTPAEPVAPHPEEETPPEIENARKRTAELFAASADENWLGI